MAWTAAARSGIRLRLPTGPSNSSFPGIQRTVSQCSEHHSMKGRRFSWSRGAISPRRASTGATVGSMISRNVIFGRSSKCKSLANWIRISFEALETLLPDPSTSQGTSLIGSDVGTARTPLRGCPSPAHHFTNNTPLPRAPPPSALPLPQATPNSHSRTWK